MATATVKPGPTATAARQTANPAVQETVSSFGLLMGFNGMV